MNRLAASMVVIPASLSSLGRRSCSVPKARVPATAGLRRIGRDVLDAELRQRPPNLGESALVHRLAGLGRVEVVAATVGVERARQAVLGDHPAQAAERAHGAPSAAAPC